MVPLEVSLKEKNVWDIWKHIQHLLLRFKLLSDWKLKCFMKQRKNTHKCFKIIYNSQNSVCLSIWNHSFFTKTLFLHHKVTHPIFHYSFVFMETIFCFPYRLCRLLWKSLLTRTTTVPLDIVGNTTMNAWSWCFFLVAKFLKKHVKIPKQFNIWKE